MSEALTTKPTQTLTLPFRPPPMLPWRDPQTVSPGELADHIQALERMCEQHPQSADLRTRLGMAYAVNYDCYKSLDALEVAKQIDPENFWAQLKYSELHYRLRALPEAERETLKAVELARNPWELSLARKQLQEIRRLLNEGTRTVEWTKPLTTPILVLVAMFLFLFLTSFWR